MDKMKMESVDMTERNIDRIAELFPNCITEAKDENGKLKKAVNFEMLRQMLSGDVLEGDEAYEFTWVGKKAAIVEANKPIRKTLRPCKEESVDWDNTENLYIEGDNLEVLKLLQESYLGKVKMIYIDPPYNTGNDFVYADDFKIKEEEWREEIGEFNDEGNRLFINTDSNGRFHSDWCSMLYSRLLIARNLLSSDGVILISIDDNEHSSLKQICDEIFGAECFISSFVWKSRQNKDNRNISGVSIDHEYIVSYSKNNRKRVFRGADRKTSQYSNPDNDPRGDWTSANMVGLLPEDQRPNCHYDLINPETGINYGKPEMGWRYDKNTMTKLINEDRIIWPSSSNGRPRRKAFLSEISETLPGFSSIIGTDIYTKTATKEVSTLLNGRLFDYPKPSMLLKELINQTTEKDSIVVDFFSGSATTADAVMKLNAEDGGNRKFIMVQLPEPCDEKSEAYKAGYKNICEIGKERIRRAGKRIKEEIEIATPFEKAEKETGISATYIDETTKVYGKTEAAKLDIGFRVLKLADSNMNDVYYSAGDYTQALLSKMESNIKENRTDLDLLFGCLLDWGLPLSMPYTSENVDGFAVHTYNDGDLIACFDENISEQVIDTIAKRHPLRAVFRDSSFKDSPSKINVSERFKMLSPDTNVKVI
jgi:adenine-specific DNA-methyltransferase